MRFEKFTTKLQEALAEAQSAALGNDNQYIEPPHLLATLLNVADKEAQKRGDQYIASELFLLAVAGDKGETGRLMKQAGVSKAALEKAIEEVRGGEAVQNQA